MARRTGRTPAAGTNASAAAAEPVESRPWPASVEGEPVVATAPPQPVREYRTPPPEPARAHGHVLTDRGWVREQTKE